MMTARLLDCEGVTWQEVAITMPISRVLEVVLSPKSVRATEQVSEAFPPRELLTITIIRFELERLLDERDGGPLAIFRCKQAFR